ncbi:MAG: dienelactone hydrolase family protein [Pseudomonadales bacterium]|jgi:dienelactone hydrolase|nr:dienelactone hydrolase family protein [Pseudomonadales bacterium]
MSDVLAAFERFEFDDGHRVRPVFRRGEGPAVIVIHEMPGLHPLVLRFGERVAAAGMTVFLPSLFGEPGREVTPGYAAREFFKGVCIRREFNAWHAGRSSPVVDWLRALAREAHGACGGAGVGAVGMCFTGGFALAMMTEPAVIAPVLSQPSMPVGLGARRRAGVDAAPEENECARRRMEDEDLKLVGLRFHGDPFVPPERFQTLHRAFGTRFEEIALDPACAARPEGNDMAPHSVLTLHLDDTDPEGPTKQAEQRVIRHFAETLNRPSRT